MHRFARNEILQLLELANLDYSLLGIAVRRGNPFGPFDGFAHRTRLDDPIAPDHLLGLGEWPVRYGRISSRKLDARAFGAGMESWMFAESPGVSGFLAV